MFGFSVKDFKDTLSNIGSWNEILKELDNERVQLQSDMQNEISGSHTCDYIDGYIDGIGFAQRKINEVFNSIK